MTEGLEYKDNGLCIEFFPTFLSTEESSKLYSIMINLFKDHISTGKNRRTNKTFGDDGVSYTVNFKNGSVTRVAKPWSDSPILLIYRDKLVKLTGKKYNYVVIQFYPSGKVGIKPHKDKEMTPGTDIAGISIGAIRTLTLTPSSYLRGSTELSIELTDGSLYILKSPTNDHWTHSIPLSDDEFGIRFSLTYRYIDM
jgi:alkylated DNA repair dioxygenase AlkB